MNAKQPYRSYQAILRKAAKESYPFAVSGQAARLARELAASGMLIGHDASDAIPGFGFTVEGVTVAGRDYLVRGRRAFGRFLVAMLLSVSSGFLGVVLARYVPAKQDDPRQRLERVEQRLDGALEPHGDGGDGSRDRREAESAGGGVHVVAQQRGEAPSEGEEGGGGDGGGEEPEDEAGGQSVVEGPVDAPEEEDAPAGPLRADPPEEGEGGASGGRENVAG